MEIKKKTNKPIILGCIYDNPNNNAKSGRGAVYDINGIAPTIVTMVGGGGGGRKDGFIQQMVSALPFQQLPY